MHATRPPARTTQQSVRCSFRARFTEWPTSGLREPLPADWPSVRNLAISVVSNQSRGKASEPLENQRLPRRGCYLDIASPKQVSQLRGDQENKDFSKQQATEREYLK